MTGYHIIVLLIVVVAMVVGARLFPGRPFLQFFGGIGVAVALTGLLALALYLYFFATGQA